jgi:hypothetical protein
VHFAGDPSVVDHHIESAETVYGRLHDAADVLGDRDINMLKRGPRSALAGKVLAIVVIEIRDNYLRTGFHESFDYPTAEARGTAGDDSNLSG